MITYRFFFLWRSFYRLGKKLPEPFFPGGLFLNMVKNVRNRFYSLGCFFEQGKKLPESGCAKSVTEHGCHGAFPGVVCVNGIR